MNSVWADLWVYGRVEERFSPRCRSGLQALWTSGVEGKLATELERAVRCLDIRRGPRLQFFRLSDGRFTVARSRASRDPDMEDRAGRQTFTCLCFLLTRADVMEFDSDPFRIAEAARWIPGGVRELSRRFGPPGSLLDPLRLDPGPGRIEPPDLPSSTLSCLERSAFQATERHAGKPPLLLYGRSEECEVALRWTMNRIPPKHRLACTFSSQTDSCRVPNGLYWAVCSTERQSRRGGVEVDLRSGRISDADLPVSPEARRYFNWLDKEADDYVPTSDALDSIQAGEAVLAGGATARIEPSHANVLREFLARNRDEIIPLLAKRLKGPLGRKVASRLTRHLANDPSDLAGQLCYRLLVAPEHDRRVIVEALERWLGRGAQRFTWIQILKLLRLARRQGAPVLTFWLAGALRAGTVHRRALEKMSATQFSKALRRLGSPLPPALFVCSRHLEALVDHLGATGISSAQLAELLGAFPEFDGQVSLTPLQPSLAKMTASDRSRVERSLRGAPIFRAEVGRLSEADPLLHIDKEAT